MEGERTREPHEEARVICGTVAPFLLEPSCCGSRGRSPSLVDYFALSCNIATQNVIAPKVHNLLFKLSEVEETLTHFAFYPAPLGRKKQMLSCGDILIHVPM